MKVPWSWLHRFVAVDDLDLGALVDVMSLHGLEVEEVTRPGAGTSSVRTKRVTQRSPHPNADTIQVVRVTDGTHETELVCGAWNFEVGDVVAHAEVGATLPPAAPGAPPLRLEARPIRGVTSHGMLCSARELQLGADHDGIVVLADGTPVGLEVTELLPIGEPVIDVEVLADRGDQHSVLGIAREVGAILDRPVHAPPVLEPAGAGDVPITIDARDGCRHFFTWTVEDVTVGPSPWWLRQRLEQCGIRAINNVVDVTNYVMLELGQPLHAFDLDRVHGPELRVRWARDGETLVTLDDQERTLAEADLVIADRDRIVSLAGVMGGADTEVSDATTRVLLEGAIWDPLTIRRTSRRLGLVSEASLRFERRVDPTGAQQAVARAAALLADLGGGRLGGVNEAGTSAWTAEPVPLDPAWCRRLLGIDELSAPTQAAALERLGCGVAERDAPPASTPPGAPSEAAREPLFSVTPPPWRGDLARPADVAEEVARIHGYDRIPATLPDTGVRGGLTRTQLAERRVREAVLAAGLHEAKTRPFVGTEVLTGMAPGGGRVALDNPLAQDAGALAPTLVEGLLGVVRRNAGQGRAGTAVFEYARIFRPAGDAIDDMLTRFGDGWRWRDPTGAPLPTQPRTLGMAAQGLRLGHRWLDADQLWSVYDLLAVCDEVADRLAPPDDPSWELRREPRERAGFHPGRSAALLLRGVEVGFVGQLHPEEAERRDLPEPVVVGELALEALLEHLADELPPIQAQPLVTHPAMTIDVALVAADEVTFDDLRAAVEVAAGGLLDDLWVFDEYRGEQVGPGKRSVAIRLRLQAADRQLTDDDADRVIAAVGREAELVGASLRR